MDIHFINFCSIKGSSEALLLIQWEMYCQTMALILRNMTLTYVEWIPAMQIWIYLAKTLGLQTQRFWVSSQKTLGGITDGNIVYTLEEKLFSNYKSKVDQKKSAHRNIDGVSRAGGVNHTSQSGLCKLWKLEMSAEMLEMKVPDPDKLLTRPTDKTHWRSKLAIWGPWTKPTLTSLI